MWRAPLTAVVIALGFMEIVVQMRDMELEWITKLASLVMPGAFLVGLIAIGFTVWKNERRIERAPFAREVSRPA